MISFLNNTFWGYSWVEPKVVVMLSWVGGDLETAVEIGW